MTTFIPKIANKILSSPAMQKNYFLKPYGLDVLLFAWLRFQRIKTTPRNIHNTNFSNIRWFCTGLAKRWMIMSWCSKYNKICPNHKLSNTWKNCTTSISKKLTQLGIRELSSVIKWELPCSLNHLKKYMWWPVTKLTPFSMESFAIDSPIIINYWILCLVFGLSHFRVNAWSLFGFLFLFPSACLFPS